MLSRYVWADLVRNPRRTLSTVVGVILGTGLTCAVLFFVDGLSAAMTQRAVAPLPIDMQRVLTEPVAGDVRLALTIEPLGPVQPGDLIQVRLTVENQGQTPRGEVVIRSIPAADLTYVAGSARMDGEALMSDEGAGTEQATAENPFASGLARIGLNIGTVEPGVTVLLDYQATATSARDLTEQDFVSTFSTRVSITPVKANTPKPLSLAELAEQIKRLDGVAFAEQLSFVDLPRGALEAEEPVDKAVRVFGFDPSYMARDGTIQLVEGAQVPDEGLLSVEAASALEVGIGDTVMLHLPDGTTLEVPISGIVDLTHARSLFASRQGADLETFVYMPNALVLDANGFSTEIMPAFEAAATDRGDRVKSPPVREIDIGVERALLDSEPRVALDQTEGIAAAILGVAANQDFLLDNISNTLAVARDDAVVARRMFLFLGIPGAVLAALLAAYAGIVLSGAQRREQTTLRIRGASRRHLATMLVMRVGAIIVVGATIGVVLGYISAALVVGNSTLLRATPLSLLTSAGLGILLGLLATGAALYITGQQSIARVVNEDHARLATQPPAWRRYGLDMLGIVAVIAATVFVVRNAGFDGIPGSVYEGRAVQLPIALLFLPIAAWIAGSLFGSRIFAWFLGRSRSIAALDFNRPLALLYQLSLKRRSWVLADAAVILSLIVALSTSLAVFTASYDGAKAADARYTVGSDLRITPGPGAKDTYDAASASQFAIAGVDAVAPVVYGVHNVVLRSNRTSDVANLAAVNPESYEQVAPLDDAHFSNESVHDSLQLLVDNPEAILLSMDMADFLNVEEEDTLWVLLARGTSERVEVEMEVAGLFERLPGFPDGADALMNIELHEELVDSTTPAFFLAQTSDPSADALEQTATTLRAGVGAEGALQIDTRLTALAKDQSSLAALNIGGLLQLDSGYALAMGAVAIAIFVFGLLLQRRREYVTLRAQGLQPRSIRTLIGAEAGTAALAGCVIGIPVGLVMAYYLINVLRPLFVLDPPYLVPLGTLIAVMGAVLVATALTSVVASSLVNQLRATELLRDE